VGYVKFLLYFIAVLIFAAAAQAQKKAQAANPLVEIYKAPSFDAEVIETIQPGQYYPISNQPRGPFYTIKLKNGKIGYVPDTELDIYGEGPFQPRDFLEDEDQRAAKNKNTSANKKSSTKTPSKPKPDDDEEDWEDADEKLSYHAVTMQLVNYHEDTLGGIQVSDLWAFGYRRFPELSDFSPSFSWDVFGTLQTPNYYKEKTKQPASGFILWSGFQIINISAVNRSTTVRYGAGPFAKFSQFEVQAKPNGIDKGYTLQDLTVGLNLEAGLIFHFDWFSLDAGLRYYWDKKPYGSIGLALLF